MRERTPEQRAKFEEEQARMKAWRDEVSNILFPIFQKFDPESLIALTPESFLQDACKQHYDCVIQSAVEAIQAEGAKRLSLDGLAHILSLAGHIWYDQWSQPVRTYSVHFRMAAELQPLLPEWRFRPDADPVTIRPSH